MWPLITDTIQRQTKFLSMKIFFLKPKEVLKTRTHSMDLKTVSGQAKNFNFNPEVFLHGYSVSLIPEEKFMTGKIFVKKPGRERNYHYIHSGPSQPLPAQKPPEPWERILLPDPAKD